jgi:hypothetical protein
VEVLHESSACKTDSSVAAEWQQLIDGALKLGAAEHFIVRHELPSACCSWLCSAAAAQ